jgi:hypothetical protein
MKRWMCRLAVAVFFALALESGTITVECSYAKAIPTTDPGGSSGGTGGGRI